MADVPYLVINNLSCAYTSRPLGIFGKKEIKPVLSNINMEIKRGEIFGLVGESGCGKTTLAKCILSLLDYEGQIIINGVERAGKPHSHSKRERAMQVQAVFQNSGAALNPAKSVGWILEEPLKAHKLGNSSDRRRQIDQTLDLVGLDPSLKERLPRELSSGQKQRVAIAGALMLKPGLIVADEPVSALDVSVAAQIINLFSELNKRMDLSLLFISHDLELVGYLCDRIAVMQDGKIKPKT